ncbi:MAG TPA: type II secretion system F family protein [Acidisarcina sp.]|nr:type II secretion system F family protein [Acidisarcina sp.]
MVLSLLLLAGGTSTTQQAKQTLAALESALATDTLNSRDQIVNVRKDELFSAVPWIHRWLLKMKIASRMRQLLYQANLKWSVGGMLLGSAVCFVVPAYLINLRTQSVLFGLLVGFFLSFAPFAFLLYKRNQRFHKFEQGLPEALDMMVTALRAGHSLVSSLGLVSRECPDPVGTEFRICFDEQNYGLELRTAMANLVTRVPLQDLKIVTTGILIQKESGGNLAEVLDKAAQLIRERFRLKQQVRVYTAQGRLTGWILSFLPLVLGVALYLVNPDTMSLLWKRPIGIKLLYTATGMTITGALIIRKIVNMEV